MLNVAITNETKNAQQPEQDFSITLISFLQDIWALYVSWITYN